VWDVVCNVIGEHHATHGTVPAVDSVHNALRGFCKSYVFQLEKSESGFEHYQGRISLIKKDRGTIATAIAAKIGEHIRFSMLATVTDNKTKEAFYQMKEQTRVAGPWSDKDYEAPIVVPRQWQVLQDPLKWRPWQRKVREIAETWDPRSIHYVYDSRGNIGKSTVVGWLHCHRIVQRVPPITSSEELMQALMGMPVRGCYIIDMPRAMDKRKLFGFYSGVEELKNGYMYDKRYHWRERIIDAPQIIIFSNRLPPKRLLSADRWQVWHVLDDQLAVYNDSLKVTISLPPPDGVQAQVQGGQEEDMVEEAQDVQPPQDHLRQEGETSNDESLRVQE